MISTQPGTTPEASFKVLALEASDPNILLSNDCGKYFNKKIYIFLSVVMGNYVITFLGPYGEQDEEQIFVQKVVPETDTLYVRLASNGKR